MSTVIVIVAIIAVAIVVGTVTIGTVALMRRRGLQRRFGSEYDRAVSESDSKLKAEAELTGRERRVRDLDIRPLTSSARESYVDKWARIQVQFVDNPPNAMAASQVLVIAVMNERGYQTARPDQVLADLSVEHARTIDRYRSAERIRETAASGAVSTEDLRLAVIGYRALFRDLLGESDALPGAVSEPVAHAAEPDAMKPGMGEAQIAEGRDAITPGDPIADMPIQRPYGSRGGTLSTATDDSVTRDESYAPQRTG